MHIMQAALLGTQNLCPPTPPPKEKSGRDWRMETSREMDSVWRANSTQKENFMRTTKLRNPRLANLALITLSILVATPIAKAACGAATHNGDRLSPELRSLQEPSAQGEEDPSDQAASPEAQGEEKHDSRVTVLGLWKTVAFSGGLLNDVGFQQFSAGGTELVNDVGAFNAGTNFCVGAWKKVGPRSYDLVHPFFLFSGTNAIGVSIEKAHLIVSRDGNRFRGTWTQDNYDLSGNLMPGFHFDGTIMGTRIAPGLEYPFPLPLSDWVR
jgi:hypothetical protein